MKIILTSFLMFFLFIGIVSAVSVTNVLSPQGVIEDSRLVSFSFTLDSEPTGCWLEIGLSNGTKIGNHSAGDIGTIKNEKKYTNSSVNVLIDGSHNYSIYCGATAATSTIVDTEYFVVALATPTNTEPTSNEIKDSKTFDLGMTVPVVINRTGGYTCQYRLYNTSWTDWADLNSTDNKTWYNASAFTTAIDSAVNTYFNISYRCNDTSGLYESSNIPFKVDSTNPVLTVNNLTRSSSVASLIVGVSDTTSVTCSANLYDNAGTSKGTITGVLSGTTASKNCTYAINGAEIGLEGTFNIEPVVTDEAGNIGTLANKTGINKDLLVGWNVATWTDAQKNLSTICAEISGCTSLSWFNNTAKTFTTYSTSVPSVNAGHNIGIGDNLFLYVTSDTYLIMNDHLGSVTSENISLYVGWNVFTGTQNASLNTTLHAHSNISWASKYDVSTEKYMTCSKDPVICTGTSDAAQDINIPKGIPSWVLSVGNVSVNRTGVSG